MRDTVAVDIDLAKCLEMCANFPLEQVFCVVADMQLRKDLALKIVNDDAKQKLHTHTGNGAYLLLVGSISNPVGTCYVDTIDNDTLDDVAIAMQTVHRFLQSVGENGSVWVSISCGSNLNQYMQTIGNDDDEHTHHTVQ